MFLNTHAVVTTAVVTTTDELGNTTETETSTSLGGILFAPEGYVENASSNAPTVIGSATLYGVLPALDEDDTVTHRTDCCDGADFPRGLWQVVGGSRGWGNGNKAVPIRKVP